MISVDRTLYVGAPEDINERDEVEIRSYRCLEYLDISYYRVDHDPAMTIADCQLIDEILGVHMCKNLFLCNRQKTDFYLLLMPGDKPFKTKELSSQINAARLSFAEAEFMMQFLDIKPGSVSVLGLMNDKDHRVRLLIDSDLLEETWIGCHPCKNTSSLRILTKDILEKFLPFTGHSYTEVKLS